MKQIVWCLVLVSVVLSEGVLAEPSTQPARFGAGERVRHVTVEGRDRSYLVHVPPQYDERQAMPVVLAFHGAWMNGPMMALFSGLNAKADQAGFIVAYPNGTGLNESQLFFNAFPDRAGAVNDVAFTGKMLDDLEGAANVDRRRVFATGMSNGGFMCYKVAAELSDRIAAIAPVAGTMAIPEAHPKRPVPVIHFHGTADRIVPYDGPTSGAGKLVRFKSVDETIAAWVAIDGCGRTPSVTKIADAAGDGTSAERSVYSGGKDGAEVVLYKIEGMGHTWPGRPALPFLGGVTRNVNANDVMWEFFLAHPLK